MEEIEWSVSVRRSVGRSMDIGSIRTMIGLVMASCARMGALAEVVELAARTS